MLHNEYLDPMFYILFFPIVFFYGICIGSFLNVVIFRLPKNESLIKRSSHCMTCGTPIRVIDLIPIFSWLALRGKCRSCGEKISPRYPIVEFLNGFLYVVTIAIMDFNAHSIACCIFFSLLICIGFMDWDTMEMDLRLLVLILLLSLLSVTTEDAVDIRSRVIGYFCISVPFFLIGEVVGVFMKKRTGEKIRGIELGDTLLMLVSGLLIGWKGVTVGAFCGIVLAGIVGLILKRRGSDSKLAFGPFLAIGLVIGTLFGDMLVDWYIGLLTYDPTQIQ